MAVNVVKISFFLILYNMWNYKTRVMTEKGKMKMK